MSADFARVSILGGGLLGGSLAMALQQRAGTAPAVRLWARRAETLDQARDLGIKDCTADLAAAVQDADLLVLAVPVGSMAGLVNDSLEAGLPSCCLITDVGSVKRLPHEELGRLLGNNGPRFIGSHPMAGSEKNGMEAASPGLFQNAACLLTNDDDAPAERAAALDRFWQSVGCRTSWMTAAAHDELVARISHLPHAVASAAALVALKNPEDGQFGGGGLRDTTRVASGNPDMWAEILIENRAAIAEPLHAMIAELTSLLGHLNASDREATRQWLASAKHLRDGLNPPNPS